MKNTDSTQRAVAKGLLHPVLPVFIFSLFLLLALGLRFGQSQQDSRQIQAHLDTEAEIMASNLQREFNILLLGLRRSADRLHFNGGITEAQWRNDARNYLQDFRVYQAMEWIDRDFYIRWIEQSKDWPELVGYSAAFNVERVQVNVQAQCIGPCTVFNRHRPKPPLPEWPRGSMSRVEPRRVTQVQPLHACTEIRI